MPPTLPAPVENAPDVARLTTGIGSTIAAMWFPPAALAAPVLNYLIDRWVKRPQKILLDELAGGNIDALTTEQTAAFIPMAYKFFEASKEGEYEHNLKILGAYIAGELKQEQPEAAKFSRIARRIEGLSALELNVIALISASTSSLHMSSTEIPIDAGERRFVSVSLLSGAPNNKDRINAFQLREILAELAGRGLLVPDPMPRVGQAEEYYYTSASFIELIERAKERVTEVGQ